MHARTDVAIAGLVPLSTVDWPGKLSATVFLQGCPLACPYCQNQEIINPKTPGKIPWQDVKEFLSRRVGLLDGVVFSGGEPCRQGDRLIDAVKCVKGISFNVGIHTCGAYPKTLFKVLELLNKEDWVGIDIKAMPDSYREATGVSSGRKAWQSLQYVLDADVSYEVRTTVYPGSPADVQFERIVDCLAEKGVTHFALQEARTEGTTSQFKKTADSWNIGSWRGRLQDMKEYAQDKFDVFIERIHSL